MNISRNNSNSAEQINCAQRNASTADIQGQKVGWFSWGVSKIGAAASYIPGATAAHAIGQQVLGSINVTAATSLNEVKASIPSDVDDKLEQQLLQKLSEKDAERKLEKQEEALIQKLSEKDAERKLETQEEALFQKLSEKDAERKLEKQEEALLQKLGEKDAERKLKKQEEALLQKLSEKDAERKLEKQEEALLQKLGEKNAERKLEKQEEALLQKLSEKDAERKLEKQEEALLQKLGEKDAERKLEKQEEALLQKLSEKDAERKLEAQEEKAIPTSSAWLPAKSLSKQQEKIIGIRPPLIPIKAEEPLLKHTWSHIVPTKIEQKQVISGHRSKPTLLSTLLKIKQGAVRIFELIKKQFQDILIKYSSSNFKNRLSIPPSSNSQNAANLTDPLVDLLVEKLNNFTVHTLGQGKFIQKLPTAAKKFANTLIHKVFKDQQILAGIYRPILNNIVQFVRTHVIKHPQQFLEKLENGLLSTAAKGLHDFNEVYWKLNADPSFATLDSPDKTFRVMNELTAQKKLHPALKALSIGDERLLAAKELLTKRQETCTDAIARRKAMLRDNALLKSDANNKKEEIKTLVQIDKIEKELYQQEIEFLKDLSKKIVDKILLPPDTKIDGAVANFAIKAFKIDLRQLITESLALSLWTNIDQLCQPQNLYQAIDNAVTKASQDTPKAQKTGSIEKDQAAFSPAPTEQSAAQNPNPNLDLLLKEVVRIVFPTLGQVAGGAQNLAQKTDLSKGMKNAANLFEWVGKQIPLFKTPANIAKEYLAQAAEGVGYLQNPAKFVQPLLDQQNKIIEEQYLTEKGLQQGLQQVGQMIDGLKNAPPLPPKPTAESTKAAKNETKKKLNEFIKTQIGSGVTQNHAFYSAASGVDTLLERLALERVNRNLIYTLISGLDQALSSDLPNTTLISPAA